MVLPKKPSHSPTCLNVTLDWNAYEAVERQSVGKLTEDENIIPSSRAREAKGDEKAYNKYVKKPVKKFMLILKIETVEGEFEDWDIYKDSKISV